MYAVISMHTLIIIYSFITSTEICGVPTHMGNICGWVWAIDYREWNMRSLPPCTLHSGEKYILKHKYLIIMIIQCYKGRAQDTLWEHKGNLLLLRMEPQYWCEHCLNFFYFLNINFWKRLRKNETVNCSVNPRTSDLVTTWVILDKALGTGCEVSGVFSSINFPFALWKSVYWTCIWKGTCESIWVIFNLMSQIVSNKLLSMRGSGYPEAYINELSNT